MKQNSELPEKKLVLIVDDMPDNLILMRDLLKDLYSIKVANNGETAIKIARSVKQPDIILLDIMMPGMDGYEVCRLLKQEMHTADIPIIFLTARTDVESESYGFEIGAADYISKPISPPIVLARIKAQLQLKEARDFQKDNTRYLEQEIDRRSHDVEIIKEMTILAIASMADVGRETGSHLRRTQYYIKALAERLRFDARFVGFLSDYNISTLFWVAPLHDIGKVRIPSHILLKPGGAKLTPDEFEVIKTHTTEGWKAVQRAEQSLGTRLEFLTIAKEMILSHHEKMDGSGYPEGLIGDDIPISARLMAIADVYDALVSKRVYKPVIAHERAVEMMREGKGTHFDADMFDAFLEIQDDFQAITQRFPDQAGLN